MKQIPPREIAGKIMTLIDRSKRELVIVSPYNKLDGWDKMRNCLAEARDRGVHVDYYVRARVERGLGAIEALGIVPRRVRKLHAKLYLNETAGIVTSMNMHLYSDAHSIEIGYETETGVELADLRTFVAEHVANRCVGKHRATRSMVAGDSGSPARTRVLGWRESVDTDAEKTFVATLHALVTSSNNDAKTSSNPYARSVTLREGLYLVVNPRRTYLQLAFRFGPDYARSKLLYHVLSAQGDAIENEIGLASDWGNERRQLKIKLQDYPLEAIATWPDDAAVRIAEIVSRCKVVLERRMDEADNLLGAT